MQANEEQTIKTDEQDAQDIKQENSGDYVSMSRVRGTSLAAKRRI